MLRVAARFGVSSSYMARVCTLLNVPRPERGHWAKLAVGKAPKQPPLFEPRPGEPLEWTRDRTLPKRARSLPKPPDQRPRRKRTVQRQLPDRHPLVGGAKPLFEAGRLSWHGNYLKPAKEVGQAQDTPAVTPSTHHLSALPPSHHVSGGYSSFALFGLGTL